MSESKHTPGPWNVIPYRTVKGAPKTIIAAGHINIARVDIAGRGENQTQANARLMAAAPELLTALEANHEWHLMYDDTGSYHGSELWTKNTEAIAKARGE